MAFLTALTVVLAFVPMPQEIEDVGASGAVAGCGARTEAVCKTQSAIARRDVLEVWNLGEEYRPLLLESIKTSVTPEGTDWIKAFEVYGLKVTASRIDWVAVKRDRRERQLEAIRALPRVVTTNCYARQNKNGSYFSSCTTK